MAQVRYAANLGNTEFPFLSYKKTRSIIIPGPDQQYVPGVLATASDRQAFIPDLYYCENVLPTKEGYQSVGYKTISFAAIPLAMGESIVDYVRVNIFSSVGPSILLITSTGKVWYASQSGYDAQRNVQYTWINLTTINVAPTPGSNCLTAALVNGTQYVFVNAPGNPGHGCYLVNAGPNFVPVVLTALTITNIVGITTAFGYMIAYGIDNNGVPSLFWSSTLSEVDFTPSLITGAGGGRLQGAKTSIVTVVPINTGFVAYTLTNAITANYSNNQYYPFTFRELVNSGGISYKRNVASNDAGESHYFYGTKGLQKVSANSVAVDTLFPEVEEFLSKTIYETFSTVSLQFTEFQEIGAFDIYVSFIAGRWLTLSYGPNPNNSGNYLPVYSYVLVYDTVLQRWGKLAKSHSALINVAAPNQVAVAMYTNWIAAPSRNSMLLIDANGNINISVTDITLATTGGVALFGKYQLARSNFFQLEEISLEGIHQGDVLTVYDVVSNDGINPAYSVPLLLAYGSGFINKYYSHNVGLNHSILLVGKFDLTHIQLEGYQHGRR